MEQVQYRIAEIKDLETLLGFEQAIINYERAFDNTLKEGIFNYYNLRELILAENAEVIIAGLNHEIVGSGYVVIKEAKNYLKFDSYGHVGFIYVKPAYRRKGISQKLITKLKLWAKSKDVNELRLNVYHENENAIASYTKLGMEKHMLEMRMKI